MTRAGVALAGMLAVLFLPGCEDEPPADPRFATPESTIETLLTAYGVEEMSQEDIQRHMRDRGQFELRDQASFRACFSDYSGPQHEGLAGYVFGTVAAGKDQLRVNMVQGKAHVFPNPERTDRYVVLEDDAGEWKISLRESVPDDIRRALIGQFEQVAGRRGGR